jgi:hypothetical protein
MLVDRGIPLCAPIESLLINAINNQGQSVNHEIQDFDDVSSMVFALLLDNFGTGLQLTGSELTTLVRAGMACIKPHKYPSFRGTHEMQNQVGIPLQVRPDGFGAS